MRSGDEQLKLEELPSNEKKSVRIDKSGAQHIQGGDLHLRMQNISILCLLMSLLQQRILYVS